MIRTVHLHGKLKEITGVAEIKLDVSTPQELFSALRSQVPLWRIVQSEYPEMNIILSDENKQNVEAVDINTFWFPLSKRAAHIHIAPVISGSGTETVAYLIMEYEFSYAAAVAVTIALNVAAAVALSYVANALAPSPDTSGGNPTDARPSFLFNGAVNVVEQGYPVPLVYGTHMTGSVVVSVGVDVAELPYTSSVT